MSKKKDTASEAPATLEEMTPEQLLEVAKALQAQNQSLLADTETLKEANAELNSSLATSEKSGKANVYVTLKGKKYMVRCGIRTKDGVLSAQELAKQPEKVAEILNVKGQAVILSA